MIIAAAVEKEERRNFEKENKMTHHNNQLFLFRSIFASLFCS
jgi:hypothetical protein